MRFARASLKRCSTADKPLASRKLSRAFCAGLIEAYTARERIVYVSCYPVRFARASLKPIAGREIRITVSRLSRAFCAGLIEALERHFAFNQFAVVIPCVLRGPH